MRKAVMALVVSMGLIAVWAAPAEAASTRAEYVAQADAICVAPGPQYAQLMRQLNEVKKQRNLRPSKLAVKLGKIVGRLGAIEGGILTQLGTLTAAPGDEATVAAWLQGEWNAKGLVDRSARAGKHGNLYKFLGLLNQSIAASERANQIVASFGFQFCVF
jgi:hypothetical protein